ncbi:MAG TPA: hypothetical protein VGJ18_18655 [Gemmatimonadaceae bacterium]|jgi:hypothetical protein
MRLINPRLHWSACLVAAMTLASSLGAQRSRLPATEISQLADEVLRVVAAPQRLLAGVPIANRELAFDSKRTLAAFGASTATDTAIRLARPVTAATQTVLSDCSQMRPTVCAGLGQRAYVWIEPISLTSSDAVVRANVAWVDRRQNRSASGSAAPAKGFLEGFSTKLRLVRDSNGKWTFVKEEGTVTS